MLFHNMWPIKGNQTADVALGEIRLVPLVETLDKSFLNVQLTRHRIGHMPLVAPFCIVLQFLIPMHTSYLFSSPLRHQHCISCLLHDLPVMSSQHFQLPPISLLFFFPHFTAHAVLVCSHPNSYSVLSPISGHLGRIIYFCPFIDIFQ